MVELIVVDVPFTVRLPPRVKFPERFAFLHVGLWGKGGFGEDIKDIGTMIKVFYESFANKKKQPALILKTSGATHSIISKKEILLNTLFTSS